MYIDGFAAAVPNAGKESCRQHAASAGALFREVGARRLVECWGDDVPDGTLTSFPMAVKKVADETVVFSWIVWPDRATRDAGWKRMMDDPRMQARSMPFDGKRMIYGGFDVLLDI